MRRLYFIRHAAPDFPGNEKYCMGTTDFTLGTLGKLQCCQLKKSFAGIPVSAVFTSPLSRAVETARAISFNPIIVDELSEMYAGQWDGLPFSEIRERWGELYKLRGKDPNIPIPGAEDVVSGQKRFALAVRKCLDESEGDIAIVAHSTVIQSFIALLLDSPAELSRQYVLPCCSFTAVQYSDGHFKLCSYGTRLLPELDRPLCMELMSAARCGENIIRHCLAVAEEAKNISHGLLKAGFDIDICLVERAALLHDIARLEAEHAAIGSRWLNALGYEKEASLVALHHDHDGLVMDEAAVIFIADKVVSEDGKTGIEERFAASARKCRNDEAVLAHQRRYKAALKIKNEINSFCGKELIP